jgi:hypothetical protein
MNTPAYNGIAIAIFIFFLFASCRKDNIVPVSNPTQSSSADVLQGMKAPKMPRGNWVVSKQHLIRSEDAFSSTILDDTSIDGCFLMIAWWQVEPTLNTYDWTALDKNLTEIANAKKNISIAILAGQQMPGWVFTSLGLTDLHFEEFLANGTNLTHQDPVEVDEPPVWNTKYVNAFTNMINALAAHLKSETSIYSKITHIKITGLNRSTEESRLPYENNITNLSGQKSTNAAAIWLTAGYLPQKAINAGEKIIDAYASAFPDKYIVLETDTVAWPTIDSKGNIVPFPDVNVGRKLINYGLNQYPSNFILQTDYLNNGTITRVSRNFVADGGTIGFQISESIYSTPAKSTSIKNSLSQAINNGVNAGAQYIEVFINDETYYTGDMNQLHNLLN